MLYEITEQFPIHMSVNEEELHISLYQPTHRHYPENKQDLIVFKNLRKEIELSLKQKYEQNFIDSIMEPFYKLEIDREFWNKTLDGIAVLATQSSCMVYNLGGLVKEFAVVNTRFHIKPLIHAFQFAEEYQLLGISRNSFSLFQGNRNGFSEIEINPEIPRTMKAVLGKQQTDPTLTHGAFGGTGNTAMYYGQGEKQDEDDKDTEKFFRYVDHYIFDNYSKESKLPLILISLKENHSQFSKTSNSQYLLEEGIDFSFESLDMEQLQNKVMEFINELNMKKKNVLIENYVRAEAESLGISDLAQIVKAAYEGRVETIFIEENRIIAGKIDRSIGKIKLGSIDSPEYGDILDDLAGLVLEMKGKVLIISGENMPSNTGVAAILRYI